MYECPCTWRARFAALDRSLGFETLVQGRNTSVGCSGSTIETVLALSRAGEVTCTQPIADEREAFSSCVCSHLGSGAAIYTWQAYLNRQKRI